MRDVWKFASIVALAWSLPCPATAQTVWRERGSLLADEARQAAAAQGEHVYAITNDRVARYDRRSGVRLAVSTGEAQHLNSGFVWQGRLYLAHSNYPHTPELSQLKVLDLETMRLTTFHDFGDFGGSLTWAVRQDGAWWCNFARYEENNSQTFLVRFDDAWRPMGRWTYPVSVLKHLGKRSISGGIFRHGDLVVTDHDHRCLYRLHVPPQGQVLELLAIEPAPFTGQGIAADPKTAGLVGINRAQRRVVFAEPDEQDR
ncbi:MAG: hypothetical protein WD845_00270 [Pirellulales bacterium]